MAKDKIRMRDKPHPSSEQPKIRIGDKIRTSGGTGLTVIATTGTGAYCMHLSPLHKPHKDAVYIPFTDLILQKGK